METKIENQNLSNIAVKNSTYSFTSILISKIGGLVFTIIIARMLLPELFGIYSLALSVATIAVTFTNLGIESTSVRYISDAIGKNKKGKARAYFKYLLKIKFLLILGTTIVLFAISKYLAYNVFDKPLVFFALIFSVLYILMESLRSFLATLFTATKNLKPTPFLELIHQVSRIFLSLLAILLFSNQFKVPGIFAAFAVSGFLFLIAAFIILIKKDKGLIFGKKEEIEKPKVLNYLGFMGIASLSLVFFASVDTLMLGKFVGASYIGYYRAALSLIVTISSLLSISGILLPIFTQIHKKRLERGFKKTLRYISIFSIPAFFGAVFIARYLVNTIYGQEYLTAISPFYALSLLIITAPLIALYSTLFAAKERAKELAKFISLALVLNIVLNYALIRYFFTISQDLAIVGAGIATTASRLFLLIILVIATKNHLKIKSNLIPIKPLLAGIMMVLFLVAYNHFIQITIFTGILEIILAAIVYISTLWWIKGIQKEDLKLIKSLKKTKLK
jgi:O-antigen/teichoic acid export membrane protein